jgi:hypothetical protein
MRFMLLLLAMLGTLLSQMAVVTLCYISSPSGRSVPFTLGVAAVMAVADIGYAVIFAFYSKGFRKHQLSNAHTTVEQGLFIMGLLRTENEVCRKLLLLLKPNLEERGRTEAIRSALAGMDELILLVDGARAIPDVQGSNPWAFFTYLEEIGPRLKTLSEQYRSYEESLTEDIRGSFSEFHDRKVNLASFMFFLKEAVSLLSRMSAESNGYSTEKMKAILAAFKNLAGYSVSLGEDVSMVMRELMDESKGAGLGSIPRETGLISAELETFFKDMDSLRGFSDTIVATNAKQLSNIRKMAEGIEDFSETIRLISMNVNIEAARLNTTSSGAGTKNAGKGFQVLAKNLSDFAMKAQDLAREERLTIDGAEASLTGVNANFMRKLEELIARVPAIRKRLEPFESIITDSFGNLERVMRTMGGVAGEVDGHLKTIIGQLQFQDLTRQEEEHIVDFLGSGFSLQGDALLRQYVDSLTEEDLASLRRKLAMDYRKIATTINEQRVIEEYARNHGVALADGGTDDSLSDGSIKLF